MKMKNKVALVTGAAVGFKSGGPSIGSTIAFKLAAEGAEVVVVDRLAEAGQQTTERIKESGGESVFIQTDVSKTEEVQNAVNKTKQAFGELHCLVNCAASFEGNIFNNIVDTPESDWNDIINKI